MATTRAVRFALLAGVLLAATGCDEEAASGGWTTEVALDAGEKVGGCAVGDVDPESPGAEIAAVSSDGRVHVIRHTAHGYDADVAAATPGELIQVAVGDLMPESDGLEIVAVGVTEGSEDDPGAQGSAVLVRRRGAGWVHERLLEDSALLHGVGFAFGGVVVTGYSNRAHLVERTPKGTWKTTTIATLPGGGRSVVPVGEGAAIACKDGSVVLVTRGEEGFQTRVLDRREAGRARIGAHGDRIVTSDDDGRLTLVEGETRTTLHTEPTKLRGAVLADLDPGCPGVEAATASYARTVTLLRQRDGAWHATVVGRDTDRFHHLTAGRLAGHDGLVLVGCGYAGRVLVFAPPRSD